MNIRFVIPLTFVLLVGCSKPPSDSLPVEPNSSGKNLCPIDGVNIRKFTDGLEGLIKTDRDWLGDKYGPLKFTCEASSIERLLEFVACGPRRHFDDVVGRDLLPKGTYQYSFAGKTWDDSTALSKDVIDATSATFDLTLEVSQS